MNRLCLSLCLLLAGCHKGPMVPTPQSTGQPVAVVAVSPYDVISPFVCTITQQQLTCMATMDVRFRRGQAEAQVTRGTQAVWHTPVGNGRALIYWGCAGTNECGPGYFMFSSSSVKVTPVEPARAWTAGTETVVPYGSNGIAEVDVNDGQFAQLRNRWATTTEMPQLKAGPGVVITCTDQACTIGLK